MQFELSFKYSIGVFILSVVLLWIFSNKLSKVVNYIDDVFNLGSSFGGTIILSIVTNLPEIAITVNGAIKGNLDLAVGNILGGIVIQSLLLVLFDFISRKESKPLSSLVNAKTSIIQGLFLIMILGFVILGKQLPESAVLWRSTVPEWLICISWISSLLLLRKFQDKSKGAVNDSDTGFTKKSAILWLVIISIVVLIFGVLLEETSDTIASHFEINGIIFGATILALVTSLPEISGGLAFVKERSYQPIISDIFGGNAFLPVLFLVASLISNNPILPKAQIMDIYLTGVAMIITTIYVVGIILNFQTRKRGLGRDSWLVLVVYILSLVGMFFI